MTRRLDPRPDPERDALLTRIAKLERINSALMTHVERATDQSAGAYSLFQTAILLDGRVRSRTEELTALMHRLERSNAALQAAKEEAERANLSKTRFLAAASHDLLQPLNAARLSSSALASLPLPDAGRTLAGQIERGLQTIEDLIKTLLDISKLDAGVVTPNPVPLHLPTALAEVADDFRPAAERKGLRLVLRCADIAVESDPLLLQRILRNLVSNAVRYTHRGGILLAGRRRGDGAEVAVIDTGCGIAEAERDLIFEEFYRGGGAAGVEGLGLGLAIVRRMAAALNHPLRLRSRPGHGSTFRLKLPPAQAPAVEAASPAPPVAHFDGAHVLVVENEPASRAALAQLLQSWGYVVTASDGQGVLEEVGGPPDIVLADYHLDAGLTGLNVLAGLRAAGRRDLPCVMMSADHSAELANRIQGAGCELMRKPVKPARLRAILSYLLSAQV